ncbi:MAG: FG-GAP-like repeat-containing protein [Aureliella sp.]
MTRVATLLILLLLAIVGIVAVILFPPGGSAGPVRGATLASARRAFDFGNFNEAMSLAEQIAAAENDANSNTTAEALMIAGEAATKLNRLPEAIQFYDRVPSSSAAAVTARWAAGEIHFFEKRPTESYKSLNAALELDPGFLGAHERMADLCNSVGMRRDGFDHTMKMIQAQRIKPDYLMLVGNVTKETWTAESLETLHTASPQDALPLLGQARIDIADADFKSAEQRLGQVLLKFPKLLEAHVQLGEVIVESKPERFAQWNSQLPESAEESADIWFLRARFLRATGKSKEALRCLGECIRWDPNHLPAHQTVAQMMPSLNQNELANQFAAKAQNLQKLNIALERIYKSQTNTELMEEISRLCESMGRTWECIGWSSIAQSINANLSWPQELVGRVTSENVITPSTPHTLPAFNLAAKHSQFFEQLDLPSDELLASLSNSSSRTGMESPSNRSTNIQFRDVAPEVGIHFQYDSNTAANRDGRLIFEFPGGGVGVLDYDLNGFPDLYLAQGGDFPASQQSNSHQDQLFRAKPLGVDLTPEDRTAPQDPIATKYEDVTNQTRLQDFSFGQGVATADVNGDGFDDILVCNIGQNQLWLNAGDGTFIDASMLIAPNQDWTVSAAIADLDFDGNSEIYEVNYVEGDDVFTKTCTIGNKPRGCSPLDFTPTNDRILSAATEGTFQPIAAMEGMRGNGLGVSIFKVESDELPSVFVAVDQEANLFGTIRRTESEQSKAPFSISNDSILAGIAYDKSGSAQACMGIATGDANNDGAIDLYVTNFYLEYYTLYLQEAGGFRDASAASGTISETNPLLGFGSQFLDADLDGNQDLFVLNGHIDDHTHIGVPEKMPPLFFRGNGAGRFDLLPAEGNFLSRLGLGRALATLDFDRDGLTDLASTDLESPFSLVRNESEPVGQSLTLRLIGTASDRNAFCSTVTLSVASKDHKEAPNGAYSQTLQLTAGSGYEASNERVLRFSIPEAFIEAQTTATIRIKWPNTTQESYDLLQLGKAYTAVEQRGIYLD